MTKKDIDSTLILKTIHAAVFDKKGDNPVILDVHDLTSIADFFYIVSGWSERQTQAITREILERLLAMKIKPLHVEGEENNRWILADFGHILVHVFLHETRNYYDLEHLWADAPRVDFSTWA